MTGKVMENTLKFIVIEVGMLKMDYGMLFPKAQKVGVNVRSSGSFITDMKNKNQTSEVVCGQQFHSCCLVSSGPALL